MSTFPQVRRTIGAHFGPPMAYTERAQNGPGIAVLTHRPGPDLSASLTTDEEH